jgi:hypothetical protein
LTYTRDVVVTCGSGAARYALKCSDASRINCFSTIEHIPGLKSVVPFGNYTIKAVFNAIVESVLISRKAGRILCV